MYRRKRVSHKDPLNYLYTFKLKKIYIYINRDKL